MNTDGRRLQMILNDRDDDGNNDDDDNNDITDNINVTLCTEFISFYHRIAVHADKKKKRARKRMRQKVTVE